MKKQHNLKIMADLIKLVKPLTGFMFLAVIMGLIGHLCASFITIFGAYSVLNILGFDTFLSLRGFFVCLGLFALVRGILRYAEQACNHYIAFKLLAVLRDKVFKALRKLCPAKLEGRDRGNLISVITSDIELLEVFYAHTISPALIAFLFALIMCIFIGSFNIVFGLTALIAYFSVGVIIPIIISKLNGDNGINFRTKSGDLSSYVLESLRGISETIQYGNGQFRLQEMKKKTVLLSEEEKKMKNLMGLNMAVTNTVILISDILMIVLSACFYIRGWVNFDGVLIPAVALFSSFGPFVALANLGSTLQNTFAAGNSVLNILNEQPAAGEIFEE